MREKGEVDTVDDGAMEVATTKERMATKEAKRPGRMAAVHGEASLPRQVLCSAPSVLSTHLPLSCLRFLIGTKLNQTDGNPSIWKRRRHADLSQRPFQQKRCSRKMFARKVDVQN